MAELATKPPEFPRHQVLVGRGSGERALFRRMEQIAREASQAEDFGWAAAFKAVQACRELLRARGLSGQALKPLTDILMALADVHSGILPELFDPKALLRAGAEGEKKWSRSSAADQIRFYAAACLGALIKNGTPKDQGAAKVAGSAKNWPRMSSGIIEGSTVVNWRDAIMHVDRRAILTP